MKILPLLPVAVGTLIATLDGYVVEQGEFAPSLVKDDRIVKGLKVTIEVSDL